MSVNVSAREVPSDGSGTGWFRSRISVFLEGKPLQISIRRSKTEDHEAQRGVRPRARYEFNDTMTSSRKWGRLRRKRFPLHREVE